MILFSYLFITSLSYLIVLSTAFNGPLFLTILGSGGKNRSRSKAGYFRAAVGIGNLPALYLLYFESDLRKENSEPPTGLDCCGLMTLGVWREDGRTIARAETSSRELGNELQKVDLVLEFSLKELPLFIFKFRSL